MSTATLSPATGTLHLTQILVSYEDAVQNNLEKILTLPDETILCPGHGPLTTVAKEKNENPFFAK